MTTSASRFIWYELSTNNKDAAAAFYSAVVGWTVQHSDQPGMDYSLWQAAGSTIGGMMPIMQQAAEMGMRPTWLAYISVADVDQSIASITSISSQAFLGCTGLTRFTIPASVTTIGTRCRRSRL